MADEDGQLSDRPIAEPIKQLSDQTATRFARSSSWPRRN